MIPIILWKEYREQRATWLVLAALVAGLLVGLPVVFAADFARDPALKEPLAVVGVVLTWAYGMVCGGMLLAGEREAKTQPFLDALPGGRRKVWVAKCIAGAALVGAFALVVAVVVATTLLVIPPQWAAGALVLVLAGGIGLGWGLYTAAFARTVLGAVGLAIAFQIVFLPVMFVVAGGLRTLSQYLFEAGSMEPILLVLYLIGCLFPLPFSALVYGRVDRRRNPGGKVQSDFRRRLWVTLWLAGRQMRGLTVRLLPLALALGLLCVPQPLVLWPFFTLVLGAICGVTCFLDEQAGPRQFLGDQRYPLGPIWGVKIGVRLLLLLAALCVAVAPLLLLLLIDLGSRADEVGSYPTLSGRLFRSLLVGLTVPAPVILFAPALTGFAVGLLSGVVFRKAFIAVIAGTALALFALGVWVPGLIVGGVPGWQVFVVPAILLVAARLLMRPWTAGRLLTRCVVLGMVGLVAGCVLFLGLGLWWRVASVPDTPEPADLAALLARMPDEDHNEAGRLIRSTMTAIEKRSREWHAEKPAKPLLPDDLPPGQQRIPTYNEQVSQVIHQGWPDGPMGGSELAGWLDRVFADAVWKRLDALPGMPLGVVDDPRRMDEMSRYIYLGPTSPTASLLAARGLQMQKRGDPEIFVHDLEVALALARNLQNASSQEGVRIARHIEQNILTALDHWLAGLSGRADLLRRVAAALDRDRVAMDSRRDHYLAEYLVARNTLDDPGPWLRELFTEVVRPATMPEATWGLGISSVLVREEDLLQFVSHIPWERERQERLLRRDFFEPEVPRRPESLLLPRRRFRDDWYDRTHSSWLTRLDAARLVVALRLHQATTGKPATDLNQLVPASIEAIPFDPYAGRPFGYRLSAGDDVIEGMPTMDATGTAAPKPRKIPAGQGILWSVGPDRIDDGGKVYGRERGDLIFLVPLEKKD